VTIVLFVRNSWRSEKSWKLTNGKIDSSSLILREIERCHSVFEGLVAVILIHLAAKNISFCAMVDKLQKMKQWKFSA
jgi:hypothetical protein